MRLARGPLRLRWKVALVLLALVTLLVVAVAVVGKVEDPLFPNDYSKVVLDEDGGYLRIFLNSNEQWILPDSGRPIPPKLKAAVIHYEDKRFEGHWGIDPLALTRALYQNIRYRSTISGASTITMQVARLMEPKERTVRNKLIEMAQSLVIEGRYSKDQILQLYLRHAPYGGNIIGYHAASLRYFGKEPEHLSWAETATLAVLPNDPARVNPNRNVDRLKEKRDGLLLSLHMEGLIDETTLSLAVAEPICQGQKPFPFTAPHLAERLAAGIEGPIIRTTISGSMQIQITNLLKSYLTSLRSQGITNGAVLVTETRTGEVKAYVASHDYFDDASLGKIDGVAMRRSSGSTLKPFLYALAMDEGLIIPQSILLDIPTSYGGYMPYNANQGFSGIVRAGDALIRSLNVPAVQLLNQFGVGTFYGFLEQAGLGGLNRRPEEYGLSLVLGAAETSLWELSRLYRGLGDNGRFSELRVLQEQTEAQIEAKQLITAGSCYLVLDIIKEVRRPGLEAHWREFQSSSPLAWKTGTSFGNRDAWAIGVSPRWTIAVWVGNFSGGSIKGMTGVDTAAPLLFQVFNRLDADPYTSWFREPQDDLCEVTVSAQTGYRLREEGPQVMVATASASAKPLRASPYERTLFVTGDHSYQVCSLCWDRQDLDTVQQAVYPPEVLQYLHGSGGVVAVPPHNPNCPGMGQPNPISFVYPQADSRIFIPRDTDGQYQKVTLEVAHASRQRSLFWYLDDIYLGATYDVHKMLITPETGGHKLSVVDEMGNTRQVMFYSEKAPQ